MTTLAKWTLAIGAGIWMASPLTTFGQPPGLNPACPQGSDAPCVPGCTFAPCFPNPCGPPDVGLQGSGEWLNWCLDNPLGFPSEPGGVRLMHHNVSALRIKALPGGCDLGVCPPKYTLNAHSMECELLFPQSWLDPIESGGQHLCGYGLAPYCIPGSPDPMQAAQGIQVDVSARRIGALSGFGQGLRIIMEGWKCLPNQPCGACAGNLSPPGYGEDSGVYNYPYGFIAGWTTFRLSVDYNPNTGVISGTVQVGDNPVGNFSTTTFPNLTPKLGNAIFWGNVDSRPNGDYLRIRGLKYW